MKYINLQNYNQNFLSKGNKPFVFFNPDNSVAVFEPEDEEVRKYVWEKGEALKGAGFYMNPGTEQTIREYLEAQKAEKAEKENDPLVLCEKEAKAQTLESKPLFSKNEAEKLLEELNSKPSAAKLAEIVKKILVALQK